MDLKLDTINVIVLIVALVNTIYGLIVFSRNRNDKTNLTFFILTLTVSFWDIGMFAYRAVPDFELATFFARILYVAASTIPISFLYFVFTFPNQEIKLNSIQKYLLPIPFIISCVISIVPSLLIQTVLPVIGHENIIVFNNWLHAYYAIYIISYFSIGYYLLIKKYFRTTGVLKIQILYILAGTAIATIIGVFSNLVLLLFLNDFMFNWMGQVGTVVMIVSISYAILKHHLFNIKVIATELLTFSLWVFILIRTLSAVSTDDKFANAILLLLTIVVGIFLIRSVQKEVSQREHIEKLATDLESANKRLTELDRQKSEFVSFASHQLRAPLTAMKGYGSLLLEGDMGELPAPAKEGISRIFESAKTLAAIVDDYLNVSRIELGTMKYTFETLDLRHLVEEVIGELRPNIEKKGLKFSFMTENPGTDYRVTADADKLKQVIANLIDNSVKYTPSGSVSVTLARDKVQNRIVFKIQDTGIGIAPEVIPHLFQKFSRADTANKVNIKGTGLGLYVAKQIVEAHHGAVRAESDGEGKGSRFIVELEPFGKA
jgi:signal transduction histidine kinase